MKRWTPHQIEKLRRQIEHLQAIEKKRGLTERSKLGLFIMQRRFALISGNPAPEKPPIDLPKTGKKKQGPNWKTYNSFCDKRWKSKKKAAPLDAIKTPESFSCRFCDYTIGVLSLGHRLECPKCHNRRGFYHCFPDLAKYAHEQ